MATSFKNSLFGTCAAVPLYSFEEFLTHFDALVMTPPDPSDEGPSHFLDFGYEDRFEADYRRITTYMRKKCANEDEAIEKAAAFSYLMTWLADNTDKIDDPRLVVCKDDQATLTVPLLRAVHLLVGPVAMALSCDPPSIRTVRDQALDFYREENAAPVQDAGPIWVPVAA